MAKINEEQISHIKALTESGKTGDQIAKIVNISKGTAHKYMRKFKGTKTKVVVQKECKLKPEVDGIKAWMCHTDTILGVHQGQFNKVNERLSALESNEKQMSFWFTTSMVVALITVGIIAYTFAVS